MVDIDDEIKYHEEVADNNRKMHKINEDKGINIEYDQSFYLSTAERYQQIADWLKELKKYKEDEDEQNKPARWVTKIIRGIPTPCCSNCFADTVYETRFCGTCGKRMENGVC
jgi:hypothetical protein